MKLKVVDFSQVFQEKLSPWLQGKIKSLDFKYVLITRQVKKEYLGIIMKVIRGQKLARAGRKRLKQWEKGWQENLNEGSIVPHYFGKYPVIRFKQTLIKPVSSNFEYYSLAVITVWLFEKYFKTVSTAYEFGCGTGHNLMRLKEINPTAELWGLDWTDSAQKIIKKLGFKTVKFDMFKPDKKFKLKPGSSVFTVAALEQLGDKFKPIVKYWLDNQMKLCVNIEPINELLDKKNALDLLSIKYAAKRNYLSGYLTYLRQLEKQGKIMIHQQQRTYIGSLFIDGYSVIAWSPKL